MRLRQLRQHKEEQPLKPIATEHGKCDNHYITVGDTETELPHPRYTAFGNKPPSWGFFSTGNWVTVKLLITSQLENVTVRADVFGYVLNKISHRRGNRFIRTGTEGFEFSLPSKGMTLDEPTRCSYTLLGNNSGNGRMTFVFDSINVSRFLQENRKSVNSFILHTC
ncbi:hypothetical protein FGIG_10593 [Fasciola gigantica]|uniref:CUB domain-containing protein n=1 Tax=Fasciola gigantica TaxID=46835 RepID=A0A504YIM0_FASGI|nr:hypothetical protein FGIG_10593 [Fasciola gigantica]